MCTLRAYIMCVVTYCDSSLWSQNHFSTGSTDAHAYIHTRVRGVMCACLLPLGRAFHTSPTKPSSFDLPIFPIRTHRSRRHFVRRNTRTIIQNLPILQKMKRIRTVPSHRHPHHQLPPPRPSWRSLRWRRHQMRLSRKHHQACPRTQEPGEWKKQRAGGWECATNRRTGVSVKRFSRCLP